MIRTTDDDETIRKRSGWLIPLGVFVVTLALSAMFLLFYLAPRPPAFFEEQVSPTSRSDIVVLKVHDLALYIPANYIEYERTRQGGTRKDVALFAKLPDLTGWSNWEASVFAGNAVDSPIVYLLIREERVNLSEADRLRRIYLDYVANPQGAPGPFGLTQYMFRDDSGYRNEDLYVGEAASGLVVMRCVRFAPTVPSPSCLRDMSVAHGVALSYRFKRARLAQWRAIDASVHKLIASFETRPAK